MPPSHQTNFAAFSVDLGQKSRLFLRTPDPPPLDPPHDLNIRQAHLLLELQKESPGIRRINAKPSCRHTRVTGRLHYNDVQNVTHGMEVQIAHT